MMRISWTVQPSILSDGLRPLVRIRACDELEFCLSLIFLILLSGNSQERADEGG